MKLTPRGLHAAGALVLAAAALALGLIFAGKTIGGVWRKMELASRATAQVTALEQRRTKALLANNEIRAQAESVLGPLDTYRDPRTAEMLLRPAVLRLAGEPRSAKTLPVPIVMATVSGATEHRASIERTADAESILRSLLSIAAPGVRLVEFRLQADPNDPKRVTVRAAIARYSQAGGPAR